MRNDSPENSPRNGTLGALGLVIVALIWLGMVLGVSYLATTAKFMAPTLSLTTALDVGRHTFQIFIKVELVFYLAMIILVFGFIRTRLTCVMAIILGGIVISQMFWLLPTLDDRVSVILAGDMPKPSNLHQVYITLEAIKAGILLVLGTGALLVTADTL